MLHRIAAAYFGGAVGALVNSLTVWLLAEAQLLAQVGIKVHPELTWKWIAHRLLWGSIWGLGYPLVKMAEKKPWRAGLLLSLAPSAAQLFYFYPRSGSGMAGLEVGTFTPLLVLLANGLWGLVTAFTASACSRQS